MIPQSVKDLASNFEKGSQKDGENQKGDAVSKPKGLQRQRSKSSLLKKKFEDAIARNKAGSDSIIPPIDRHPSIVRNRGRSVQDLLSNFQRSSSPGDTSNDCGAGKQQRVVQQRTNRRYNRKARTCSLPETERKRAGSLAKAEKNKEEVEEVEEEKEEEEESLAKEEKEDSDDDDDDDDDGEEEQKEKERISNVLGVLSSHPDQEANIEEKNEEKSEGTVGESQKKEDDGKLPEQRNEEEEQKGGGNPLQNKNKKWEEEQQQEGEGKAGEEDEGTVPIPPLQIDEKGEENYEKPPQHTSKEEQSRRIIVHQQRSEEKEEEVGKDQNREEDQRIGMESVQDKDPITAPPTVGIIEEEGVSPPATINLELLPPPPPVEGKEEKPLQSTSEEGVGRKSAYQQRSEEKEEKEQSKEDDERIGMESIQDKESPPVTPSSPTVHIEVEEAMPPATINLELPPPLPHQLRNRVSSGFSTSDNEDIGFTTYLSPSSPNGPSIQLSETIMDCGSHSSVAEEEKGDWKIAHALQSPTTDTSQATSDIEEDEEDNNGGLDSTVVTAAPPPIPSRSAAERMTEEKAQLQQQQQQEEEEEEEEEGANNSRLLEGGSVGIRDVDSAPLPPPPPPPPPPMGDDDASHTGESCEEDKYNAAEGSSNEVISSIASVAPLSRFESNNSISMISAMPPLASPQTQQLNSISEEEGGDGGERDTITTTTTTTTTSSTVPAAMSGGGRGQSSPAAFFDKLSVEGGGFRSSRERKQQQEEEGEGEQGPSRNLKGIADSGDAFSNSSSMSDPHSPKMKKVMIKEEEEEEEEEGRGGDDPPRLSNFLPPPPVIPSAAEIDGSVGGIERTTPILRVNHGAFHEMKNNNQMLLKGDDPSGDSAAKQSFILANKQSSTTPRYRMHHRKFSVKRAELFSTVDTEGHLRRTKCFAMVKDYCRQTVPIMSEVLEYCQIENGALKSFIHMLESDHFSKRRSGHRRSGSYDPERRVDDPTEPVRVLCGINERLGKSRAGSVLEKANAQLEEQNQKKIEDKKFANQIAGLISAEITRSQPKLFSVNKVNKWNSNSAREVEVDPKENRILITKVKDKKSTLARSFSGLSTTSDTSDCFIINKQNFVRYSRKSHNTVKLVFRKVKTKPSRSKDTEKEKDWKIRFKSEEEMSEFLSICNNFFERQ